MQPPDTQPEQREHWPTPYHDSPHIVQCLDRTDPADGTMSKAAKPAAFATGSGIAGAHPHNVRVANPASFPSPYKPAKQQRWIVPFRLVADGESGLVPQRMKR